MMDTVVQFVKDVPFMLTLGVSWLVIGFFKRLDSLSSAPVSPSRTERRLRL